MQSAGINRGALYTHYSSLGELAFALLADGYREIADVHLAARAGRAVDPATVVAEPQRRIVDLYVCLLYTSPSPRDQRGSRMPSSA